MKRFYVLIYILAVVNIGWMIGFGIISDLPMLLEGIQIVVVYLARFVFLFILPVLGFLFGVSYFNKERKYLQSILLPLFNILFIFVYGFVILKLLDGVLPDSSQSILFHNSLDFGGVVYTAVIALEAVSFICVIIVNGILYRRHLHEQNNLHEKNNVK